MTELPIGTGTARRPRVRQAANDAPDVDELDVGEAELEQAPPATLTAVPPLAPLVEPEPEELWRPERLERPLQVVVGKSVNYAMRRRTGVETKAGLMSSEHAEAIAEPLCEVMNRTPLRALAKKQTEIALGVAIYDYVQETVHTAGRDVALVEQELKRRDRERRGPTADLSPRLPIDDEGEVPQV